MPWQQLGFPDKGRAIKGLAVCYNLDLEHLVLLNGLALGCYQLSPKVVIVLIMKQVPLNAVTDTQIDKTDQPRNKTERGID